MTVRAKPRPSANSVEQATLTVNERILRECHALYTDPDGGLLKLAKQFGLELLPPRKKIVILLIGNHSAGKSSFINWYVEEHVQKTGVAIETKGYHIVTSGKKRETLMGPATLHLFPHFRALQKIPGVVDFLTTEISSSKQKNFSLVTFVDSPGLVDGDMQYPFDVNEAIMWLGKMADLIFVFFDPIGQAFCKRTLNVVERLNADHPDKMRFYLSKADEAGIESDRQRVLMQIVQELCKRPGLNRTCFDMPTIFIPELSKQSSNCINQIDTVSEDIDKTINQAIQNILHDLEKDCVKIEKALTKHLEEDAINSAINFKSYTRAYLIGAAAAVIPAVMIICTIISSLGLNFLQTVLGKSYGSMLFSNVMIINGIFTPNHGFDKMIVVFIGICGILFAKYYLKLLPTLNKKQKRLYADIKHHINNVVKKKQEQLYKEYLQQFVIDNDISEC